MILPDSWEAKDGEHCPNFFEWMKSRDDYSEAFMSAADCAYRKLEEERLDPLVFGWKLKDWRPGEEAYDHDDVLVFVAKAILQGEPWTDAHKGRFDHVLVDEVQDTSISQWLIVRFLAKTFELEADGQKYQNLMAVGDDQQCVSVDTIVKTDDGMVRAGDIRAGSMIEAYQERIRRASGRSTCEAIIMEARAQDHYGFRQVTDNVAEP